MPGTGTGTVESVEFIPRLGFEVQDDIHAKCRKKIVCPQQLDSHSLSHCRQHRTNRRCTRRTQDAGYGDHVGRA